MPDDHPAGIAFEDAHSRTSSAGLSVTQVIRAVIGVQVPGPARLHPHIDVELKPLAGPGTHAGAPRQHRAYWSGRGMGAVGTPARRPSAVPAARGAMLL